MIFSGNGLPVSSITLYPVSSGHGSHMDGAFADRKRGFLDGFGTSRMGVAGARQSFRGAAKFHQNARFVDHFAGFAADDMHAEHTVGFRICENLHETVSSLV